MDNTIVSPTPKLGEIRAFLFYKAGLLLHDFCRVIHQISYDMKRRLIAEDHII